MYCPNATNLASHVIVGIYDFRRMCAAHQFLKMRETCILFAGGTMLRKDVPPLCFMLKDPAVFAELTQSD